MQSQPSTHGLTQDSEIEYQNEDNELQKVQLPVLPEKYEKRREVISIPDQFKTETLQFQDTVPQSLQYLTDGLFLAVGCMNGLTKIVSSSKRQVQYVLKHLDKSPVTSLAANPNKNLMRNAVMITHSEGTLQYWHATSKQLLFSKKYEQALEVCEISPTGLHYAFAGDNGLIRIGNLGKGEALEVETGHLGNHDNRIFSLKWNPNDQNMLLSGGWDKAVHFWDIRTKTSTHKLFGYYMGGQSIDFADGNILLGSNSADNPLRIYDLKAGKVQRIDWPWSSQAHSKYTTGVLACFFDRHNQIIACTPHQQIRLFTDQKCVSQFTGKQQNSKIYCLQKHTDSNLVVAGWSKGQLTFLSY